MSFVFGNGGKSDSEIKFDTESAHYKAKCEYMKQLEINKLEGRLAFVNKYIGTDNENIAKAIVGIK